MSAEVRQGNVLVPGNDVRTRDWAETEFRHEDDIFPAAEEYNPTIVHVGKKALALEGSVYGRRRLVMPLQLIMPVRYVPPIEGQAPSRPGPDNYIG